MHTPRKLLAAAAITLAVLAPASAQTAGVAVLQEGFNDGASLPPGWLETNNSLPAGNGWIPGGNTGIFSAQDGAAASYIAASFLSAQNGSGTIDNWLITPELTLPGPVQLSFYTRTQGVPGMNDMLEVRFSPGAGTATSGFTTLLTTVGGPAAYPDNWQQFTVNLAGGGSGRFAFRYLGDASAANFIGIDTVLVTAVPEPSAYIMLGLGLAGFSLLRHKPRLMSIL